MDEKRFLRQQLTLSKNQLKNLFAAIQKNDAVGRLASTQACIVSLDLGVRVYLMKVFELVSTDAYPEQLQKLALIAADPSRSQNYKQSEISALFSDAGSWLSELNDNIQSLHIQEPIKVSDTSGVSSAVIASSSTSDHKHWTFLDENKIEQWLEQASNLLERHSDQDVEW